MDYGIWNKLRALVWDQQDNGPLPGNLPVYSTAKLQALGYVKVTGNTLIVTAAGIEAEKVMRAEHSRLEEPFRRLWDSHLN